MKKLILVAAIAATSAGAVNAATIYEGKGLTYKLKGDLQVQLRDNASQTKDAEIEFDDLELKNSVIYDLGSGMKAFGQLDFGFKNAAEDKSDYNGSQLEEAYIGIDFGGFAVAAGKQNYATDEFGVEGAYEHYEAEDAFDEIATDGDDVIRFDASTDNFTLVASTELKAEGEGSENGSSYDLFVATELGGVELAAAYQTYKKTPSSDSLDSWGLSAAVDLGSVELGADYSTTDTGTEDLDIYNLMAKFEATDTTSVGVGVTQQELDSSTDVTQVYANVTYKFPTQKNVSLFAEVSDIDEDGKDLDLDMLMGMRIKF
ncbi:porin [Amphritea opalescens]|uniref:Porin n=1 Tax=Amphritea opalescens TaxID=2490544 RepID=A0A430KP69_9GAMM|nr:porin [Amphritea opalescens]RTE65252.1 porin [Amphritea opalescens]